MTSAWAPPLSVWSFPTIYPILDSSVIPSGSVAGRKAFLLRLGSELFEAGVTLLEYRNKTGPATELISDGAILRASLLAGRVKLILDDRVDLVEIMGFDGVHVDAGDVTPAEARRKLGPELIVGTFGGSEELLPGVLSEPADYWSVGPVGATRTKETTRAPIGVEGVRRLRAQAGAGTGERPGPRLVAVGGVTLENAAELLEAGASMVAVAGAIFRAENPAAEFRRWTERLRSSTA